MAVLRVNVQCYRCKKEVSDLEARKLPSVTKEPRYECFACFKKYPLVQPIKEELNEKKEFYCERCKYKFTSRKLVCPYCNQDDCLIEGNVTIHDLL